MAVNLVKYKDDLLRGWQEVIDDKNPTNWVLFTYEGQSYDLKVFSKGDGGVSEMADDLNSSKIMYAFCKVKDPKTSLPKNVLVNWQGEGTPAIRKGTCANHLSAIEKFFKGIHVTINARTEDEVDEGYILEKVAKASGSAYNFSRSESREKDESRPVGAIYQRINPNKEIDAKARDSFWAKEEEEEKRRQAEELKRKEMERKRREEELKQRELEESRAREQQVKARMRNIAEQRQAEEKALARSAEEVEKIKWAKQREEDEREDEQRRMRSEILRRQRSQEAQALIKQRSIDARAVFEQNTAAGQLNSRRSSSSNVSSPSPTPTPTPTPTFHGSFGPTVRVGPRKWPPTNNSYSSVSPTPPSASPTPAPVKTAPSVPSQHNFATPPHLEAASPTRENHNGFTAESPTPVIVPPAPEFADIPQPVAPTNGSATLNESNSSPVHDLLLNSQNHEEANAGDENQDWNETPEDDGLTSAVPGTVITGDVQDDGIRARALYDYQADDEGEISFDPGDIITHIDQIDPGWWQGLAPDGTYGLFPANYVELIQD